MNISMPRLLAAIGFFLAMTLAFNYLPDDARDIVLPIVLVAIFIRSAIKAPPFAIALLLYYSMVYGSWFILAAAPGTMLLARRYQRQRLDLELNPVHIRRTVLLAMTVLVATLPFIGASFGPWSEQARGGGGRSASPLIPEPGSGQEGVLQRFARWLGFGDQGARQPGGFERLQPVPVRPPEPDDPFNWWIIVAIVAVLALILLAVWLWRRRSPKSAAAPVFEAARPLARLEAVGESIGRPRAPFEGAITYGQELARRTGDQRLAAAGPLVSSQVYESAFVNPSEVDANLVGLETTPPPAPPRAAFSQRLQERIERSRVSVRTAIIGLVALIAVIVAGWIIVPRLGDLDNDRFEFGAVLSEPVTF